jgi:hypothetical protein
MRLASMPPIVVATQMLSAFLQIVDMFLMMPGKDEPG